MHCQSWVLTTGQIRPLGEITTPTSPTPVAVPFESWRKVTGGSGLLCIREWVVRAVGLWMLTASSTGGVQTGMSSPRPAQAEPSGLTVTPAPGDPLKETPTETPLWVSCVTVTGSD